MVIKILDLLRSKLFIVNDYSITFKSNSKYCFGLVNDMVHKCMTTTV